MQRIQAFYSSTVLCLAALVLALPACDEPSEVEDSVDEDDGDGEFGAERTGRILLENGNEVTYTAHNGKAILDGDILIGDIETLESDFRSAGSVVHQWGGIWPGGVVYFQIQPGFQAASLVPAIQHWEALTGIQFVNAAHPSGYVQIGNFGGCYAHVGRQPNAISTLSMTGECDTFLQWVHEIGHTVGLHHEQARSDRDNYVNVLWHNIRPDSHHNYQRYIDQGYTGYDLGPYDISSVMHYHSWAYSVDPNNYYAQTMNLRANGQPIYWAPQNSLSAGDVQGVGMMYGIW